MFQICSFALPVEFFEIVKNYQTSDSLQENALKESNYTDILLPFARRFLPVEYSKNCQTSSIAVTECAFHQTKRPVFSSVNIFLFSTVRPRVEEFNCLPGKCGGGTVSSVNVK